jgi:hypothetical protein
VVNQKKLKKLDSQKYAYFRRDFRGALPHSPVELGIIEWDFRRSYWRESRDSGGARTGLWGRLLYLFLYVM